MVQGDGIQTDILGLDISDEELDYDDDLIIEDDAPMTISMDEEQAPEVLEAQHIPVNTGAMGSKGTQKLTFKDYQKSQLFKVLGTEKQSIGNDVSDFCLVN